MRLSKSVIDIINNSISNQPYEIGGILGSYDNIIIDQVILDLPNHINTRPCSYFPNVEFLNQSIESWHDSEIYFIGIFHTHFGGAKNLSCGDKKYILAIMDDMPQQIDYLYFPIFVLPNREFICYKATRINGIVNIQAEDLVIE